MKIILSETDIKEAICAHVINYIKVIHPALEIGEIVIVCNEQNNVEAHIHTKVAI